MASTNQSPQYQKAEVMFLQAQNDKDKLKWLEEMIKLCPRHKSSEKMLANLKTRRKKFLEKLEKGNKRGKGSGSRHSIKKEEMQAVIVGFTNSGKSTLLSKLTNALPEIANYDFTTKIPLQGMTNYHGTKIQMVEIPAFESEYYDKGIVHTADVILVLVNKMEEIPRLLSELKKSPGKKIIVYNMKGKEDERKLEATLKSKRYNFILIGAKSEENFDLLKDKIFESFGKMRIFTKEPGQPKSDKPMILSPDSTIKDIAEKIIRNISQLKETKIWGPSSKFPGQVVGLQHKLKDLDVVEFKTR